MDINHIKTMLDALADFQAQRDALELRRAELIHEVTPPEVQARIDEINAEFQAAADAAEANIKELSEKVKAAVIEQGATVKGAHLMAVWNKGRVSWDGKRLDGMMALIPGLAAARSEGEPSVTLRAVK